MTDVHIARFRRHYRLSANTAEERARLDRVFREAFAESLLDAALERAGFASTDEVCIRQVQSLMKLDGGAADNKLAVACTVALADAIVTQVDVGGDNVVRYASTQQALVDMALNVARGRLQRRWAWRQLGLWRAATDAFTNPSLANADAELFGALARNARSAPAILATVAQAKLLRVLMGRASDEHWVALAKAVLLAMHARDLASLLEQPGAEDQAAWEARAADVTTADAASQRAIRTARRVNRSSLLLSATLTHSASINVRTIRAVCVLALTEREPIALLQNEAARTILHLARLATSDVASLDGDQPPEAARDGEWGTGAARREDEGSTAGRRDSDSRSARSRSSGSHDAEMDGARLRDADLRDAGLRDADLRDANMRDVQLREAGFSDAELRDEPADARFEASTDAGGLLFLLHAVAALNIPERIVTSDTFSERSLAWTLHVLAMMLLASRAHRIGNEVAVAAFCGHPTSTAAQFADEPAPTTDELSALQRLHAEITTFVRSRGVADEHESDAEMLRRIIVRRAVIVADAAWIDVRLSLADVSTDIRRAGLDLDLGWLPWLGVVVRFTYA